MKTTIILLAAVLFLQPTSATGEADHDDHHGHADEHQDEHEHGHGEESGVKLADTVLRERGVTSEVAGAGQLARVLKVNGRVSTDQNKLAHIHPRFSGVVKEVRKELGDSVEKGEALALVESNQSLKPYEVVTHLSGTVLFRHATVGEYVTESEPIFVVADLTSVWIDLFVFPRVFHLIRKGLPVKIRGPHADTRLDSTISFVSRVVDERTQARVVRAVVGNKDEKLYPDQYLDAEIVLESVPVPLAVKASAVQRLADRIVIFAKTHEGYEPRDVVVGKSDGELTQILSGIEPGVEYAAGNTFLLKAELGKGSAEHEH